MEEVEGENGANSSDQPTPTNVTSPIQGRRRQEPVWMEDYVSGEGLSEEEDEVNIASCCISITSYCTSSSSSDKPSPLT